MNIRVAKFILNGLYVIHRSSTKVDTTMRTPQDAATQALATPIHTDPHGDDQVLGSITALTAARAHDRRRTKSTPITDVLSARIRAHAEKIGRPGPLRLICSGAVV